MGEQFILDFGHAPALDRHDFLVSECNREAAALVNAWPDWPAQTCLIAGPAGCGKSHLVNVWRELSGGDTYAAAAFAEADAARTTEGRPVAIEDVDRGPLDERALFHLLNLAREHHFHVLLTARTPPGEWEIALPDLRSRFRSLPVAQIGAADDGLLKAVLVKQFSDRQLRVPPEVIDYLARRIERSLAAVGEVAASLDRAAMLSQRRITRRLAAEVLGRLDGEADEE